MKTRQVIIGIFCTVVLAGLLALFGGRSNKSSSTWINGVENIAIGETNVDFSKPPQGWKIQSDGKDFRCVWPGGQPVSARHTSYEDAVDYAWGLEGQSGQGKFRDVAAAPVPKWVPPGSRPFDPHGTNLFLRLKSVQGIPGTDTRYDNPRPTRMMMTTSGVWIDIHRLGWGRTNEEYAPDHTMLQVVVGLTNTGSEFTNSVIFEYADGRVMTQQIVNGESIVVFRQRDDGHSDKWIKTTIILRPDRTSTTNLYHIGDVLINSESPMRPTLR